MATPRSGSGQMRPVPELPNKEAAPNGLAVGQSDSDSGGRRHAPSSMSRVQSTPQQDRAAMQQVQQRISFSDHSAQSSARSTPRRKPPHRPSDPPASEGRRPLAVHSSDFPATGFSPAGGKKAPPPRPRPPPPPQTTVPAPAYAVAGPGDSRDSSEPTSEGEIKRSASVSAILSKLDSVKQYLREAESLQRQLKAKSSEPGMVAQIEKLGQLVAELREQESAYLGLLLTLMDREGAGEDGEGGDSGDGDEEEGEEESEEEEEEESEGGEEQAVSLKASMAEQAELEALRQQQEMLRSLLEQQKQIRELEERQAQLLRLKQEAQSKLVAAEAKTQELQALAVAAEEKQRQEDNGGSGDHTSPAGQPQEGEEEEEEGGEREGGGTSVEKAMQEKLQELQARKQRMDHMMAMLSSLTENRGAAGDNKENLPVAKAATRPQPAKELQGGAEMVRERGELSELQSKLAEAAEARKRLKELKEMVADLQQLELREEEEEEEEEGPNARSLAEGDTDATLTVRQPPEREPGELERSLVAEYQQRLATKRQEVRRLQQQRDELMQTQERLRAVHTGSGKPETKKKRKQPQQQLPLTALPPPTISELSSGDNEEGEGEGEGAGGGDGELSPQLAAELRKQKQLYEELMRKTARLQQLQAVLEDASRGSEHDTYSLTSSTRILNDVDLTAATWGGSTGQSETEEEEEEGDSSLLPSELDTTQEDAATLPAQAAGLSETVTQEGSVPPGEERLQFSITRHAASSSRAHRRLLTPTDDSHSASGKRMKLDDSMNRSGAEREPGGREKAVTKQPLQSSHFSAVWPGVIFPRLSDSPPPDRGGATAPQNDGSLSPQGRALPDMGGGNSASQPPAAEPMASAPPPEYSPLLQQQLTMTTGMCSELLRGQNCLIGAVCHRLDGLEMSSSVQQHMACLQQYHFELDSYYRDLCQSYAQIAEQEPAQDTESEDPVAKGGEATAKGGMSGSGASIPTSAGPVPFQEQPDDPQHYYYPGPYGTSPPQAPLPGYPLPGSYEQFQQSGRSADASASFGIFQQSDAIPPPPIPPFPAYQSPFQYPGSWFHPSPYHRSPFSGSHDFSHLPASSSYNRPLSTSAGYNRPLSQWPYAGTGMTPYGQFHSSAGTENQNLPRAGLAARYGGLGSPSGVTATSLQVQPPSSPPSAPPSVSNLQRGATSANSTSVANASTQCFPNFSAASSTLSVPQASHIPTVTSTTPHSSPHTLPTLTHHPPPVTSKETTSTGTSLAEKGREMAVTELKEGIAASGATALLGNPAQLMQDRDEEESLSSLPLSMPEDKGLQSQELSAQPPVEFSVFDALRDTIYSEVATLIASNENRPHFLVELFRELQLLTTDYLRQRALYFLQELVTQHLTDEALASEGGGGGGGGGDTNVLEGWGGGSEEGHTPSESGVTSEDDLKQPPPPPLAAAAAAATVTLGGGGFDYAEAVHSASSVSTPPTSFLTDEPFASDNLGDTVIRLDKAMSRMRGVAVGGTLQPPVVSPGPVIGDQVSESSQSDSLHPGVDSQMLDEEIKAVMTDVIPILKENMSRQCSEQVAQQITQHVLALVLQQEQEMAGVFRKQLEGAITTTLDKYLGKRLHECGEDLLVDVSEVLYNELAVFRLMQELKSSRMEMSSDHEEPGDGVRGEGGEGVELELLQALGTAVSKTLQDEAESLGKSRDDELAKAWDDKDGPSSFSADEEQWVNVELSVSESKPITSTGSGDEEEQEEGDVSQTVPDEPSQTQISEEPGEEKEPGDTSDQTTTGKEEPGGAGGGDTSLTPVVAATGEAEEKTKGEDEEEEEEPRSSGPPVEVGGEEGEVGGEEGEGGENKLSYELKLTTITQEILEAQMKAEELDSSGLGGVLSTMAQGQELAGQGDELLPAPVAAEP